jgi:hypothetical protein
MPFSMSEAVEKKCGRLRERGRNIGGDLCSGEEATGRGARAVF